MATREDATLIVQIMQWAAMSGLNEALGTVFSDDFDPETAKGSDPHVRTVLNFGEAVGTFVKHGLLDRDLVLDMWAMHLTWKRVGPVALKMRERSGEPRIFENFEALARSARVPAGI